MTKDERKLAKDLNDYDSVELHKYSSVNGHSYYKVKVSGRALNLVKCSTVERMEQRIDLVKGEHSLKILNVSQLKANLLDWQIRQDELKDKKLNPKPKRTVKNTSIIDPF